MGRSRLPFMGEPVELFVMDDSLFARNIKRLESDSLEGLPVYQLIANAF